MAKMKPYGINTKKIIKTFKTSGQTVGTINFETNNEKKTIDNIYCFYEGWCYCFTSELIALLIDMCVLILLNCKSILLTILEKHRF